MISVKCACGAKYSVKDERSKKSFVCPKCGDRIRIPAPDVASQFAETADQPQQPENGRNTVVLISAVASFGFCAVVAIIASLFYFRTGKAPERGLQAKVAASENIEPPSTKEVEPLPPMEPVVPPVQDQKPAENQNIADEKREPVKVLFSLKRKFHHSFEVLEKQANESLFVYTLTSRADKKMSLVFVDLWLQKSPPQVKQMTLNDFGQFRLFSYFENWQKLNPKELTLVIDGKPTVKSCKRNSGNDKLVDCQFTLEEFQKMLAAKKIDIEYGPLKFELTGSHIEGLRDLSSRVPDGTTFDGMYAVLHQPDGHENDSSILNDGDSESDPLAALLKSRKAQLADLIKKIESQKEELKKATIADDAMAIDRISGTLVETQLEFARLLEAPLTDAPLPKGRLSPNSFRTGQIGTLPAKYVRVLQILNRRKGEALIHEFVSPLTPIFKIAGADLSNHIDGSIVDLKEAFVVVGTEIYKTVGGDAKAVFRLEACDNTPKFSDAENQVYLAAMDTKPLQLTQEEQAQAEIAKTANAKAKAKAQQEKAEEDMQNELTLKARRAKSSLDSAKLLLKKDQHKAARKYLEKAIADDPDSETGKEAAKLLEELP